LVRYLRQVAAVRPEVQVLVSSHAGEIIAACQPEELVVLRQLADGRRVSRMIGNIPLYDRERTLRMAKLHMDATRSASLFAGQILLVEGVSDSVLVRQFGRAWAAGDPRRQAFVDALTITVIGTKVGRWPVDLLAAPGYEVASRIAILTDTDTREGEFTQPSWITDRDPLVVRAFYSAPTLEPAITAGNEAAVGQVLDVMGIGPSVNVTAGAVDHIFQNAGRKRKGEFALQFAAELSKQLDYGEPVSIPVHFQEMFEYLHVESVIADADPPSADA
jgi:putative ATP-dependent endonuclease of OLD family